MQLHGIFGDINRSEQPGSVPHGNILFLLKIIIPYPGAVLAIGCKAKKNKKKNEI
jgi:hypothetical protein